MVQALMTVFFGLIWIVSMRFSWRWGVCIQWMHGCCLVVCSLLLSFPLFSFSHYLDFRALIYFSSSLLELLFSSLYNNSVGLEAFSHLLSSIELGEGLIGPFVLGQLGFFLKVFLVHHYVHLVVLLNDRSALCYGGSDQNLFERKKECPGCEEFFSIFIKLYTMGQPCNLLTQLLV